MKKTIPWAFFMALMLVFSVNSFGQGSEDFETSDLTGTYADGTFVGADNLSWSYVHSRDVATFPIDGKGIMLRRADEPSSLSVTFDGGIGNFSVDTRKAFTGDTQRQLELVINGTVVEQFQPTYASGEDATVVPFVVEDINIEGTINLTLRLYGADGNQQMILDNIVWTGYEAPFTTLFQLLPTYFGTATERGLAADASNVYVASRNGGVSIQVNDRLTGAQTGTLNITNITGGTFPINDIEVTEDGVIIAGNLAIGAGTVFKLYTVNATDPAEELLTYTLPTEGGRYGDKFTVVGRMDDGTAKIYAPDATAANVVKWSMITDPNDATAFIFDAPEVITLGVAHGNTPVVTPKPDGSFFYTASGQPVSKLNADGSLIGTISAGVVASSSTAMKYLGTEGNDEFLAIYQFGDGNENLRVVKLTNGDPANAEVLFTTPSMYANPNGNGAGDIAYVAHTDGNADLYVLGTDNGIGGYTSTLLNLTFPDYDYVAPPTYAVTFDVTDISDAAITDAVVTLNGVTNAAGDYVFEIEAGTYDYSVTADGYDEKTGTVTVVDADVTEPVQLAAQTTFTVAFDVTNSAAAAVTDAVITLGTITNTAGDYTFADVAIGDHAYTITATGYEVATGTVTVVDADVNVAVELMDELPRFTATFVVEDEAGVAIDNAVVILDEQTNAAGDYVFESMLAGTYDYTVDATGYQAVTGTIDVVDMDVTETVTLIAYVVADPLTINTFLDASGESVPTEIGTGGNARSAALYMDRYVIVPSREDGANIWVWDAMNPHLEPTTLDMGTDLIVGGLFTINYVEVVGTDIYVSNMSTSSNEAHPFRVYRWSSLDAAPELVLSADGDWGRLGDAFTIVGDPSADGSILAHVNNDPNPIDDPNPLRRHFRRWDFVGGVLQNLDTPELITLDIPGAVNVNSFGVISPIAGEDNLFLATGNGAGLAIANLDGTVLAYVGSDVFHVRTMDPQIFNYDGRRFLSYVVNNEGNDVDGAYYEIIDITPGADVIEALTNINSTDALDARRAHKFVLGAGAAFLSATHRVSITDANEVMLLSHVVARGFVLETTGALPTSYALTLAVDPADSGTVTGEGNYYEGATVPLTANYAAGYQFVNWTEGTTEVSTEPSFDYTMPAAATTLTANFEPLLDVATLAELRDKPADGIRYRYTGEAVVVAMDDHRNRKFLQDATAAILIDDNDGVITTEYDLYDVVTNVEGRVNIFRNMVQFVPTANAPESTENTPVDPTVFTMDELTADDQAKLITLKNVTFKDLTADQVFVNGTNYTLTDGTNEFVLRTDFWNVDYIGDTIPTGPLNISGVVISYNETLQLVPRFEADIEPYIAYVVTFTVDMSPADNFDPAVDTVYITGSIIGWPEPGKDKENQRMTRVDDSMTWSITMELEAGDYEYKYFLNHGWDGGEWTGDPNRTVTVDEDKTVSNIWGDPVNVNQPELVAVNVYPNPARDYVNITSGGMIRNLVITDITGKVVYNDIINDTQVRLNNQFRSGIYIVSIQTDKGVIVRKLQIQ